MVDYSKWQNIEVSDDEEDCFGVYSHSLFRQNRQERMEKHKKEVEKFEKKKADHDKKISEVKEKLSAARSNLTALEEELKELEKEGDNIDRMEQELKRREVKAPLNTDTIGKPGFSKTVINTATPTQTEEEKVSKRQKFIEEHEAELKHYGLLRKFDESRAYLRAHDYLVCENTADYLISWCVALEVHEEDRHLIESISHQHFCMRHILESAKRRNHDPRVFADVFYAKVDPQKLWVSFQEHLPEFKHVLAKLAAEQVEHMRQMRLGPGGLDPVEVFESLPIELQLSFETQNHYLLRHTVSKMKVQDMIYHMNRCIESGLWIPQANLFDLSDLFYSL